jgi:hypothetical protein
MSPSRICELFAFAPTPGRKRCSIGKFGGWKAACALLLLCAGIVIASSAQTASSGIFTSSPAINTFTPTSREVGTIVTITGTTFPGATSVTLGGVTSAFTVEARTRIAATVPPSAVKGQIGVTTPGGIATSATTFSVTTSSSRNNTPFQHVIVIFQENRTPDNLFGSTPRFEPGVNIRSWGYVQGSLNQVSLQPRPLADCYNPDHSHRAWVAMYDHGKMDGALNESVSAYSGCEVPTNPEYVYVSLTPGQSPQPYFDIATNYGFANYMFQTNQGPSFPAHQFIFSGTSAPTHYNEPNDNNNLWWEWFAAENAYIPSGNGVNGCTAGSGTSAPEISWSGVISGCAKLACYTPPDPPNANPGFPCYDYPTLVDLFLNQPFNGNPNVT